MRDSFESARSSRRESVDGPEPLTGGHRLTSAATNAGAGQPVESGTGPKNSKIETVFFDLGNVLLDFDFGLAARKLSRLTERPEPELTWSVATVVERTQYELGRASTEEFVDAVRRALGIQMDRNEFRDLWSDIFRENEEMIALARSLRGVVPRRCSGRP